MRRYAWTPGNRDGCRLPRNRLRCHEATPQAYWPPGLVRAQASPVAHRERRTTAIATGLTAKHPHPVPGRSDGHSLVCFRPWRVAAQTEALTAERQVLTGSEIQLGVFGLVYKGTPVSLLCHSSPPAPRQWEPLLWLTQPSATPALRGCALPRLHAFLSFWSQIAFFRSHLIQICLKKLVDPWGSVDLRKTLIFPWQLLCRKHDYML